uniref:Lipoprotein n=1 Tax=Hydrogenovibrio crunogenus (strain DSM 25203 / XCL-2) TaxID=317025 RepID=Q31HS6_HYDCU
MKNPIAVLLLTFSAGAVACGTTHYIDTDRYGNNICRDMDGKMVAIQGTVQNCPAFYQNSSDKYGNEFCGLGKIHAYDLSKGCLSFMSDDFDKHGNKICTLNGKPVISLIKNIKR